MKDQALPVNERLVAWREKYARELGRDAVDQATAFAAGCYLAFDVRDDPRLKGIRWARVPAAAIISATGFGARPAFRPPSARPAEHAAHKLKSAGAAPAIVHDYLEALLGLELDPWEVRKRLRECKRRLNEAARKAGDELLKGITAQRLEEQLVEAQALQAEIDAEAPNQLCRDDIVGTVQRRMQAFPKIRAGEFNDRSPLVWVDSLSPLARDLPGSPGGSVKIEWPLKAIQSAHGCAAALVSVPGWYPLWVGFPVPGSEEQGRSKRLSLSRGLSF